MSDSTPLADRLSFLCRVSNKSGAYTTNTVRGKRASNTSSAIRAADLLGFKVLGAGYSHAEALPRAPETPLDERFMLHSRPIVSACCHVDGVIGFGPMEYEGQGLPFAAGPDGALQAVIGALAAHPGGHADGSPGPMLVPIWPQTADQEEKSNVLEHWMNYHAAGNGHPNRYGVIFGKPAPKGSTT